MSYTSRVEQGLPVYFHIPRSREDLTPRQSPATQSGIKKPSPYILTSQTAQEVQDVYMQVPWTFRKVLVYYDDALYPWTKVSIEAMLEDGSEDHCAAQVEMTRGNFRFGHFLTNPANSELSRDQTVIDHQIVT